MISVVIVNYHSAHLAERAVKSVFRETEDLEVIVVDNGSTLQEKELLHELSRAYPLTLILNEKNAGFARANNQAFALSKGEYVLLLNPDAFVVPPSLGLLRDFIEHTPDAGSVSPLVYWDDAMRFFFPLYPFPSPLGDFWVRLSRASALFESFFSLNEKRKNLRLWKSHLPLKVKNLHGGVVMVKRSAVERAGGLFDERFFLFYEDTDLFFRLRKSGHGLYIVPGAKAVHNYMHKRQKLDRMAETNRLYYEKHFNRSFLARVSHLIPCHGSKKYIDHGRWEMPPSFHVADELKGGYLFEWSPDPLFIPSIGCFGKGEMFVIPGQVWGFLDPGVYYSRITDPRRILSRGDVMQWRKEG